jgi:hypothetical protein
MNYFTMQVHTTLDHLGIKGVVEIEDLTSEDVKKNRAILWQQGIEFELIYGQSWEIIGPFHIKQVLVILQKGKHRI